MGADQFQQLLLEWNENYSSDELTLRCAKESYELGLSRLAGFFLREFLARNPGSKETLRLLSLLGEGSTTPTGEEGRDQVLSEEEISIEDFDLSEP